MHAQRARSRKNLAVGLAPGEFSPLLQPRILTGTRCTEVERLGKALRPPIRPVVYNYDCRIMHVCKYCLDLRIYRVGTLEKKATRPGDFQI